MFSSLSDDTHAYAYMFMPTYLQAYNNNTHINSYKHRHTYYVHEMLNDHIYECVLPQNV